MRQGNEIGPIENGQLDARQHAADLARWEGEGGAPKPPLSRKSAELSRNQLRSSIGTRFDFDDLAS